MTVQAKSIRSNTISLFVLQGVRYLAPLITLPFLTRVLGSEYYAIRAYTVSVMTFAQVLVDFGFAQYGTREFAVNSNNTQFLSKINTEIFVSKLIIALLVFVALIVIFPFMRVLNGFFLYYLIAYCVIVLKALVPDFAYQGLENMGYITSRFVCTQTLSVVLILMFVRGPSDLLLIPIFEGVATGLSVIWGFGSLWKRFDIRFGRITLHGIKSTISGAFPYFLAVAASAIMGNTITVSMGVFGVPDNDISYWSVAATVITGLQALYQPLTRSLFPYMVKAKDMKKIGVYLKAGIPLMIVVAAACVLLSANIMSILGGEEFSSGASILAGMAPIMVISYPAAILGYPVIAALGYPDRLSKCVLVSALIQLLLVGFLGVIGAVNVDTLIIVRLVSEVVYLAMVVTTVLCLIKQKD